MNIVGHHENLRRLFDIATAKNPAQAYIFYGLEGIGKKMAAFAFAKAVNCTNKGLTGEPCNTCTGCLKVEHLNHPDIAYLDVLEDKKDIVREQALELISFAQMSPIESKFKIGIINNADRMNASAANTLLKTLEEPPTSTTFILITSRLNKLLPTILSRCQKFSFAVPPISGSINVVSSQKNVDENAARLLLSICGGSIGMALSFNLDILTDVITSLRKIRLDRSAADVLEAAQRWGGKDSEGFDEALSSLLFIHYEALKRKLGKRTEIHPEAGRLADELAKVLTISSLSERVDSIMTAKNDTETTYNKQLMFEQLLFTLAI